MSKLLEVQNKLEEIFAIIGVNLNDPSVQDTPKRIAKMWCNEIFTDINYEDIDKLNDKMTFFEGNDESPVTMTMKFNSWCEHHLMPFFGDITITYIPNNKIIGLSKIPRIVEYFSQRPQLQERLGKEIGDYIQSITGSELVKVEIYNTTHTCVSCRGIRYNADTKTTYITRGEE